MVVRLQVPGEKIKKRPDTFSVRAISETGVKADRKDGGGGGGGCGVLHQPPRGNSVSSDNGNCLAPMDVVFGENITVMVLQF